MQDTQKKEDVSAWAAWALVDEVKDGGAQAAEAAQECVNRLARLACIPGLDGGSACPIRFVVLTQSGHWGTGQKLALAAQEARKAGAGLRDKAVGVIVLNDETPEVNSRGELVMEAVALSYALGVIGTVGSLINAAKS